MRTARARLRMHGRASVLAVVAAGLVLVAALPERADAHAALVAAEPSDGSVLDEAPAVVRFTFDAAVVPVGPGVRVLDAAARRVDGGPLVTGSDGVVGAVLPEDLVPGVYVATYRVASDDGHPLTGSATFTVAPPAGGAGATEAGVVDADEAARVTAEVLAVVGADRGGSVVRAVASTLRTITYLTALTAVGAVLFGSFVARGSVERDIAVAPVRPTALATIAASLVAVPVQVVALVGLDRMPVLRALGDLASVPSNRAVLLRLVGAAMLVLVRRGPVALVSAFLVLASFVVDGHQVDVEPNEVLRLADTIHLITGSLWLGGVVVLALVFATRTRDPERMPTARAGALVTRFSGVAVVSVALTLLSGAVMAGILIGDVRAGLAALYGRVFASKLALVGLVLAVAAYNRRRMLPLLAPGAEDDARAWRRLVTTVRAEAGLILGVLVVTGVLVAQDPPASPAAVELRATAVVSEGTVVDLVVDPARVGRATIHIYVSAPDGRPDDGAIDLVASATPPEGEGPVPLPLAPAGRGHWIASTEAFDVAGTWRLRLIVVRDSGASASVLIDVPIAR